MTISIIKSRIIVSTGDKQISSEKGEGEEEGGKGGVEKELFLLLQSMVRSNNDVMQGNKDLMASVLQSSRITTMKGQSSADNEDVVISRDEQIGGSGDNDVNAFPGPPLSSSSAADARYLTHFLSFFLSLFLIYLFSFFNSSCNYF